MSSATFLKPEPVQKRKMGPQSTHKPDYSKPNSEKSIAELWWDAQYDITNGGQPQISAMQGIMIEHLGERVRAPTTWHTLQDNIDKNSNVHQTAQQIDNGDFSDDEDEEEDLSSTYPQSPNSSHSAQDSGPTPPPSYDNEESYSSGYNSIPSQSQQSTHQTGFTKPKPKGRKGGKRVKNQISIDEPSESSQSAPTTPLINNNNSNNKKTKNKNMSQTPNVNTSSIDTSASPKITKLKDHSRHRTDSNKNKSMSDIWFQAQLQLSEGKQPSITQKYNVRLHNVRIHVKKYADHAKHFTVQQDLFNARIGNQRKSIAVDDDDDDDDETDVLSDDASVSDSNGK